MIDTLNARKYMYKKNMLFLFSFLFFLAFSSCTSERLIIKDTGPCNEYLELKNNMQNVPKDSVSFYEAKLATLKAACAHSGNTWPAGSDNFNRIPRE